MISLHAVEEVELRNQDSPTIFPSLEISIPREIGKPTK
jgi:hypothetical protein